MRNREFKENFCKTRKGTDSNLFRAVLARIEILEDKYDKDAAYFNRSEILELYHMIKYVNPQSYRSLNRLMVRYCDEFNSHRIEYSNCYMEIDTVDYERCADISKIKEKIITKESLNALVSSFPDDTDKAIVMLLWHGVQGENLSHITNLKRDNLVSENTAIYIDDHEYILDRSTVLYLKNAFNEDIRHSFGNGMAYSVYGEGTLYKMTGKAMNTVQTDSSRLRWIRNRLSSIKKYYNLQYFDAVTIRDSGLFHKIVTSCEVADRKRVFGFLSTEYGTNLLKTYLTDGGEVTDDCRYYCIKKFQAHLSKSTE